MSRASDTNGRVDPSADGPSVLANLPRTRPQRATERRTASRRSGPRAAAQTLPADAPADSADAPARKPRTRRPAATKAATSRPKSRTRAAKPRAIVEQVPRQGFECEDDRATGSVPPPGGAELLSTAFEALSEIAKAGISGSERLLRDVLSRLPR